MLEINIKSSIRYKEMTFKIKIPKMTEQEVTTLRIDVGPLYWDDAEVNGVKDSENGDMIPFKDGDKWKLDIDLSSGKIKDWPFGTSAKVYYNFCETGEDGYYALLDKDGNTLFTLSVEEFYFVPSMLGPYISFNLDIDEEGFIKDWQCNLKEFQIFIYKDFMREILIY